MIEDFSQKARNIIDEVEKVIIGKRFAIKLLMIALLSGGHVLIEDVPGVGKTTLASALAKATGLISRRAQFTPDVMASDITGFTMFNKEKNAFVYKQGLIMCNIFLADEINRAPPKTQSALLEAMEERTVTVEGKSYPLQDPFMVIATQNELGYVGTYPLPEAQLDRFLMKISIGYPTLDQEISIISSRQTADPIKNVRSLCSRDDISSCVSAARQVNIQPSLYRYIVQLTAATRSHKSVQLGASPRASLLLMRASQSKAFIDGRDYVTPEDVLELSPYVLCHRIQLTREAKIHEIKPEDILEDIIKSINAPYKGGL